MIKQCCTAFLMASLISSISTSALAADDSAKMSDKQKLSYLLGLNTAKSMTNKSIEIDTDSFLQGMNDTFANKKSLLSAAESNEVMMRFQKEMQSKAQAKVEKESSANIAAGKKFITDYKKQTGVVSLPNGIVYKIIKAGSGAQPTVDNTVVAHYTGKLVNGTVFDSSVKRGQPSTFPLKNVIKGWQEVLPLMKVGAKWEAVIPPQLAYGERGPGSIGSNSTLIFEIELIEVKS